MSDQVNHPSHYMSGTGMEVIDVIEAFELSFFRANIIKYVIRAGRKDKSTEIPDLEKARWYLDRMISNMKGDNKKTRMAVSQYEEVRDSIADSCHYCGALPGVHCSRSCSTRD